jgi:PIN domain nuclease of toxin-antitoxin system
VIWYLLQDPSLSANALAALRSTNQTGDPVLVASVTLAEVVYLVEKGRLPHVALHRLSQTLATPLSGFEIVPLDTDIALAVRQVPRLHVPDMPDRIIAATALNLGLPLVTADRRIQQAGIPTIW